jgi:lysophospholipase L1-like esterase
MSVQVSYKKQTLLGLLLILLIIIGLEAIAHTYDIFYPHCIFPAKDAFAKTSFLLASQMCLDNNKILYYVDTILLFEPDQHSPTININSHGFRGPEISLEKPDNTYRIFMVGGSTTFGTASTSDETTITGFLQKKFNELQIEFKIEIINAGIGGADSAREVYYINNILNEFNPDMYIIYDGYNDAVRELEYGEFGEGRVDILGSAKTSKNSFKFSNYPQYRTPFMIHDILFYNVDSYDVDRYVNPDDFQKKVELWENRWSETCKTNNEKNIKMIIMVHPILGGGDRKLSQDEELMLSKSEYHKTVIKTVDLMANKLDELNKNCDKTMDLLYSLDGIVEPIQYDLVHVNDVGNKVIAEKIYEKILPIILKDISK